MSSIHEAVPPTASTVMSQGIHRETPIITRKSVNRYSSEWAHSRRLVLVRRCGGFQAPCHATGLIAQLAAQLRIDTMPALKMT